MQDTVLDYPKALLSLSLDYDPALGHLSMAIGGAHRQGRVFAKEQGLGAVQVLDKGCWEMRRDLAQLVDGLPREVEREALGREVEEMTVEGVGRREEVESLQESQYFYNPRYCLETGEMKQQ